MTHYRYHIDMTKFRVRHAVTMMRAGQDSQAAFPEVVAMLADLSSVDVLNMPYSEFPALMEDATVQMAEYFAQVQQQPRLSILDIFASAMDNEPRPADEGEADV